MHDRHLARKVAGAVTIERVGAIWRAVWSMGDLHPQQEMQGEAVTMIPLQDVTSVETTWSATASNRRGVVTGSHQFDVLTDRIVINHGVTTAHE